MTKRPSQFRGSLRPTSMSICQPKEELEQTPWSTDSLRSRLSKSHHFSGCFQSRARKRAVSSFFASSSKDSVQIQW
jgi:hypothetical protein